MRVSKEIYFYIPASFKSDLDKRLLDNPPPLNYCREQFYCIISHIVDRKNRNPKKEFLPLNKRYLKDIIGSNYSRFIKYLKNNKFIICDRQFEPGKKAYWYKLNLDVDSGQIIQITIEPGSDLYQKVVRKLRSERSHYNRMPYFLKAMNTKFKKVELDYPAARKWVQDSHATAEQRLSWQTSIQFLEDSRFRYFKRNSTNRRSSRGMLSATKMSRTIPCCRFLSTFCQYCSTASSS